MNAIQVDIDVYVDAAFAIEITLYQDEKRTLPFDFTGYDGVAGIFDEFGNSAPLEELTIDFNVDRTDGVIRFLLNKTGTLALEPFCGSKVWDAVLGASSADEEVFFRGTSEIHPKGSRRGV